ncbi:hypothetical protein SCP_0900960 [Sparassis crispa]|uniref:Uncharacterized protein n=1 Tax=Sparassis crispa TaxID=139825 RepID=A0A401GVG0_9APHY|nr:hypothetical protein SCP_0900960 [Sparassis crispa]GBE86217.1 hypothetical protein SCP_0900960 [Sparassis crispa]
MADPQNSQDFESEDAEPAVISLSDVISPSHTQAVFGADQATHKGDSSTTLNPTFERVLSARNAHVWVPIIASTRRGGKASRGCLTDLERDQAQLSLVR